MPDQANQSGFGEPETFTVENATKVAWTRLLSPVLLLLLVLGFLVWMMITALFNVLGLPAYRLLGLLATLVLLAGIVAVWVLRTAAALRRSWLRVDPQGMTIREGVVVRQIAWTDMRSVGRVVALRRVETSFGGSSAKAGAAVGAGVNRAAQQLSGSIGLLGLGTLTPVEGSRVAPAIIQQNAGVWGHDESGAPLVGIAPLDVVDDWYAGRVGDWLRHHRPDLATEYERQQPSAG